jgi:hypothetical protein
MLDCLARSLNRLAPESDRAVQYAIGGIDSLLRHLPAFSSARFAASPAALSPFSAMATACFAFSLTRSTPALIASI